MKNNDHAISLNLNVRGIGRSATVAINERSDRLIREGRSIYKLGLGQSPFPVPAPVTDALRFHAHQKDYLPVLGLRTLREAVAQFHRRSDDVPTDPDRVMIGPGSKELMFLLQLAFYGDLILPTPCWVSYEPQAEILGRRVHKLQTRFEDRWRLQPDDLERLCARDPERPRLVILNYPGNPDGTSYDDEELRELAEVARRFDLILLSDEIYAKLDHLDHHISIARYYPEGTIISSGLSKWCGAGGWRLGTFCFPESLTFLMEAMASVASETFTSTSAPIQFAAITAFRGGYEIERYLVHARRILAALGGWCTARLRQAGVRLVDPRGGFYLFIDMEPLREGLEAAGIHDSMTLCERALEETGVAFLPGVHFGRPATELTARLAYVNFDGGAALAASESLGLETPIDEAFLRRYCGHTLTAMDLLHDWLAGMHA